MKNHERHAFERELQKDPFAEEAVEGLSMISPEEVEKDLDELQSNLNRRTHGRKNFIFYRIAASIAVLLILSSVIIMMQRKNLPESSSNEQSIRPEIAQNEPKQEQKFKENAPAEKYASPDEIKTEAAGVKNEAARVRREQKETNPVTAAKEMEKSRAAVRSKSGADSQPAAEKPETEDNPVNTARTPPDSQISEKEKEEDNNYRDTKKSASVPADAKSGGQVYPSASAGKALARNESEYIPPQPENGEEAYDRYIRENIRIPAPEGKDSVVVMLSFTVKEDGTISKLKILESPGRKFSDEAKRLVKDGPAWKPAVKHGENVEGEVMMNVVFK